MLPSRDSGCKVTAFSFIHKELHQIFFKKKWAHDITSEAHTTQTQNCGNVPLRVFQL